MGKNRIFDAPRKAKGIRVTRLAAVAALALALTACAAGRVAVRDPLDAAEHIRLAGIYEAKAAFPLALDEYIKAAEAGETNGGAWFSAGNMALRLNRLDEAETYYRKAIAIDPGSAVSYNNLGWLYMEKGEMDKAEAEVNEALRLDPIRPYIYLDTLGVIALRRKAYGAAAQYLNAAYGLVPETDADGGKEISSHLRELDGLAGDKAKTAE
ncbi:MAG: tetratricopeptide repeat protein [Deltaproteobacteria bacterium]|nr:tetratricopeptide repeat protein [Deltaproteobacteria bacterium]